MAEVESPDTVSSLEAKTLNINIHNQCAGTTFVVAIKDSQTVEELKNKIEETQNIPANSQLLVFLERELANHAKLNELGLCDGSNLNLSIRLQSGRAKSRSASGDISEAEVLSALKKMPAADLETIIKKKKPVNMLFKTANDLVILVQFVPTTAIEGSSQSEGSSLSGAMSSSSEEELSMVFTSVMKATFFMIVGIALK
eukprot:Colp12_sorted_trinity150504_noHs@16100